MQRLPASAPTTEAANAALRLQPFQNPLHNLGSYHIYYAHFVARSQSQNPGLSASCPSANIHAREQERERVRYGLPAKFGNNAHAYSVTTTVVVPKSRFFPLPCFLPKRIQNLNSRRELHMTSTSTYVNSSTTATASAAPTDRRTQCSNQSKHH